MHQIFRAVMEYWHRSCFDRILQAPIDLPVRKWTLTLCTVFTLEMPRIDTYHSVILGHGHEF